MHAVEAERAIQVADLAWQEQAELAASLHDLQRVHVALPPLDAVVGPALVARPGVADLQLRRRYRRCHEVELTDRADVLAERRALEQQIHDQREREVTQDDPRGRGRPLPDGEQLVREQHQHQQAGSDPFAPQLVREREPGRDKATARVADEHHRATGAEQVAGSEHSQDEQPAPVNRREHRGKVAGTYLWTEQPVQDDAGRDSEQDELEGEPNMPPMQEGADHWQPEDIHVWTLSCRRASPRRGPRERACRG